MNLEINNRSLLSTSKPLPADKLASVEAGLKQRKDGADTLGVKTADGQTQLILTRTAQKLSATSNVRVDGQPAKVLFAENETNTAREGAFRAAFSRTSGVLVTGAGAMLAVLSYGMNPQGGLRDLLLRFVVCSAALSPIVLGAGALLGGGVGAVKKIDNKVSDRLLKN